MNKTNTKWLKKAELLWEDFKGDIAVLGVIIIIVLLLLLIRGCDAQQQLASNDSLNTALKDSMKTWRNKEGDYMANITLLQHENSDYFTKWTTADSTVIELQELVKKYEAKLKKGGNATVIKTDANINIVAPSKVSGFVTVHDTVYANYKSDFNLKSWVWGTVSASKDSTKVNLRFKEQIDVVIGTEKTGFLGLGKSKPFAEVTLHNPFNTVSTLRAYSNKPVPSKKFGVGPVVAYGIGSGFIPEVFVGVGINYTIFKF